MRVLVTRAASDAAKTAQRLAALGHEPIVRPLTRIVSTGQPCPVGHFDAVAVTSAHALQDLDISAIAGVPVYVVGQRTAASARSAGFLTVHDGGGTAEALSNRLLSDLQGGSRVLFLAGELRKPTLEQALSASGIAVHVVETYRALPDQSALRNADFAGVDAVLHYSRASADRFVEAVLAGQSQVAASKPSHLCLSEDVSKGLAPLYPIPILVAATPDEGSLFALLAICRS